MNYKGFEMEHQTSESKTGDLKLRYSQMVADIKKATPEDWHKTVINYQDIFLEIFVASIEKLAIYDGDFYFANGEDILTDFGAVVLNVIHTHEIDRVYYEVELLILSQHEKAKIVTVNSSSLDSSLWIKGLGAGYWYKKVQCIQKTIQIMAQLALSTKVYNYSGWVIDESDTYLLGSQMICAKKSNISEPHEVKAICKYVFTMLDVAERRITIPILAVALLSLVQSKMIASGEYYKGVFCLRGQSQSGKTQLFKLLLDFLRGLETDANFEATLAALIRKIGSKRDATATFDDYKPPSNSSTKKAQIEKLEKIIRMCSDDSHGYQKAGSGKSTVADIAHCIVAITAEEIQLSVQSTLARLLIVDITQKSMNWDNLTYFQRNHDSYKTFIVNYILHISAQGVENYCANLAKRFQQERHTLRNRLLEKDKDRKVDNRTSDQCTWLYISFDLFLTYALEAKAINQEQFERHKKESLQVFLNLMEEQAERINDLDDMRRFFNGLRILLDTKEARLDRVLDRYSYSASEDSKSAIGFSKKGYIYLKNEVAFRAVTSYCKRYGKDFVMSEATLRKRLDDNGYLFQNPPPSKSPIHRLSVNHESYQCIRFEKGVFEKLLKGGKNDDTGSKEEIRANRLISRTTEEILG